MLKSRFLRNILQVLVTSLQTSLVPTLCVGMHTKLDLIRNSLCDNPIVAGICYLSYGGWHRLIHSAKLDLIAQLASGPWRGMSEPH